MNTGQHSGINFEDAPLSPVHKKVATGVFLGQVTDGFTLSIVGTGIGYATKSLNLTDFWVGLISAGAFIGILFGSLCIGPITDKIGRKLLFSVTMLIFAVLSVLQFFISDPLLLTIVRLAIGVTIGIDYTVSAALLTEWTPKRSRARMLSSLLIFWIVGFAVAYAADLIVIGMPHLGEDSWRWILCSSAIPGALAFIWRASTGIPESPGWLARKGRKEEALALIHNHLGTQYCLPQDEQGISTEKGAPSVSWFTLFGPELRHKTLVGGIFYACQVFPFFGIGIFLPLVLANLNIENPHAPGILYNVSMVIGVVFGVWLVDKISRRAYLMWTFYISAVILTIIALWHGMPPLLLVIMLSAFALVLSCAAVLENTYPPELFPTELRGSGVGFSIAVSRLGAAAGTFLLPVINTNYGIYASLGSCVIVLWFGTLVCQFWAPETSVHFQKNSEGNSNRVANKVHP
ncbi:Inner membrane metabolite transport protein YgcS [Klebsiella huaxiensis]|uniref:Inner membrane metabolite transport protein YgcS n=2 Tax=Klebsiella huaxiensis TaxID=2153354 RepID=A0A564KSY1_9ENTR|nr:Inner membrane metabolite transport protein YgcS [Klebsiella huaxiensis]